VRNLFDQYSQQENRLTHALAVCLNENRDLLKAFLKLADVDPPVPASKLHIVEQGVPGEPPQSEDEAERRGLPDIVIHDDDRWCLLIESKVQAGLTADQLHRHTRTMEKRGFAPVHVLALTKAGVPIPAGALSITWCGLYEWLGKPANRGEWADRLRAYLRAAEVRLAREGYLTEGTLTQFDGFPFSPTEPYTYGEGKRLLNLALRELRKDKSLLKLGMDPEASGRPAITGRGAQAVWDFLQLADRPKGAMFTAYPHLTLGVHTDRLSVAITIPNGINRHVLARLASLDAAAMADMNTQILKNAAPLLKAKVTFEANAMQRHYPSQRAHPIDDAQMKFKLETSLPTRTGAVKRQPEWAALLLQLLKDKRSNIQFQYVANMPWGTAGLNSRGSLAMIAGAWTAMEPLLDVLRGSERV
jgi:hypothetical protein